MHEGIKVMNPYSSSKLEPTQEGQAISKKASNGNGNGLGVNLRWGVGFSEYLIWRNAKSTEKIMKATKPCRGSVNSIAMLHIWKCTILKVTISVALKPCMINHGRN